MLNSLFSLITHRLLWGLIGISALALTLWVVGPLLSIADWRPLESERSRLMIIALLYLLWVISHLLPRLYNAWLNRQLMGSLSSAPAEDQPRLNSDDRLLTERFNEAAQLLKKAHFTRSDGQRRSRWLQRFSSQYLYQLPWYMIIGAPGAGKTTALVNSGLQFPLAERFGKTALRGIGGTRNCDWWFTNDAVLLDTAGRYTMQQSQQQQDAGEWQRFVALLRKYRGRQPVNGVIITLSVSDLLTQNGEAAQQHARSLRQRLTELREQLAIHFPVYVLVTKVDLLKGFRAYFSALDKPQREQIWGFTFPWQQAKLADFDLNGRFSAEYALLQQRLDAGLADTLLQESDAKMRAESYLFPQQFAALRLLLSEMLGALFSRSDYDQPFSVRGVYFASGTQEGLPFDRVMGELNRAMQLPPHEGSHAGSGAAWDSVSKASPIPASKGQSFFLKQLLQEVVFQESGLAGSNRWWELRHRALLWSGYILLLALMIIAALFWLTSFSNNKAYLQEMQAKVPQVEQQSQQLQTQGDSDLFSLLPFLNSLQHLAESQYFDLNSPPLTRRMGLYRGGEISDASTVLYQKSLKQLLLPQVAQAITRWLRSVDGSDADYRYEALKAYQMLYQPKQYDGKFLRAWLMLNIQRSLPAGVTQLQLNQLEAHLVQLLETQIQTSPYARDDSLVAREQMQINQLPLSQRVYGRLKRMLEHDDSLKPVSLASLAGSQSELVFSRQSGKPASEGLAGLYTPDGYWLSFNKNMAPVTAALHQDDLWVLGGHSQNEDRQQTDNAVRQRYISDFIAQWESLLQDIQLNSSSDLTQRINTARLLSANNSPLRRLVINLGQYLMLEKGPDGQTDATLQQAVEPLNNATRTLQALFRSQQAARLPPQQQTPEQAVTSHFAAFLELAQPLEKGGEAIVFDDIIKQIDEVYRYLNTVQDAANSGMPPPASEPVSRLQASAGRLPPALQKMLTSLAIGASSDTQRRDLENVSKRINMEVGSFCRQAIAGRYPLARAGQAEVTPDDLARMFAPGSGLMDAFFRDNLANKVDTTQANWRFMPGIDGKSLPGGEAILRPFQQAQSIRDAFFASGATSPSFRITVRTLSMDNDILNLTLDVDGQQLRFSHGPQAVQQVSWPGPGGTSQVRMQLGLTNGTTSTLVTNGPWALNRFFDRARLSAGSSSLSRQAAFNLDGHQVALEFTPGSIRNPFQLSGFSCP
ncbi:type VI secretion system membrane subunit TssM [Pantoea sp. B65]|uniref:type VI secretion system membrane subunit TssM n=1 Tax=Pantoea sp. B65 TaxID=2813359 RepID=UPI0039B673A2